ncbi:Highly reducing polyketide synthase FUM1 [Colletotrichum shisoi]|uniref:Highly reducing polyketide synthase FUM1 n=1 Tax=Colletotrichum shisoi TaxID=2078593 RepID=A0A5Q4BRQ9_9PEZI|nr:Highly reducing polyketide synthase FUM1 [Colletotrichum shisoi]
MPKSEVERADPQKRPLLELTRECLESAGETAYRGRTIGTFVGCFGEDWLETLTRDGEVVGQYKITGYGDFMLSNRLAYEYDLKGPSMTIRTGCSSALIGLHEACMSISHGQCDAAVVAGSNLIMAPGLYVSMSEQGVLSPSGSCRTFDAGADGYARGEAVNVVYVKRLGDAVRDGNPIRAVIRGTSSNADGRTPSLTIPSFESHEAMIRRAYKMAAIGGRDIADTGFVECHGTGTAAGDPIETTAIAKVFGGAGVYIGSCKPNIGHSEGASGITSLIKSVLALEHRTIPPNIKFDAPNPKIPFAETNLRVPIAPTPWPEDRAERVSVNSFGIGGANAHVVLESAASFLGRPPESPSVMESSALQRDRAHLMVYSANTADSLRRQVVNNQKYIGEHPGSLDDISYTLASRRGHLPHRAFSVMQDGVELTTSSFWKAPNTPADLALVFTGQGAQWPQMGAELLKTNRVFAQSLRRMDKVMQKGQHIGKMVMSMDGLSDSARRSSSSSLNPSFDGDASYLLVGGLGGLGRLVSNWMVEHGARHLVYLSRNGGGEETDDNDSFCFFRELADQGCWATAVRGSVTSLADVERAIGAATRPVRGVINLSMVLRDQGFANMSHEEWETAVGPKVQGTWNLHRACADAGLEDLDFFLLFSSISGVVGQRGQANYAAANTFLDAFVQYRQALGLRAGVVDIGAMVDHGHLADNPALMERLAGQGFYGIRIPQLLDALALGVIQQSRGEKRPAASSSASASASASSPGFVNDSQLVIGHRSLTSLADGANRVLWKRDRRMGFYFNSDGDGAATSNGSSDQGALASFVKSAAADPGLLSSPGCSAFVARQIAAHLFRLLLKPAENEDDMDVGMSLQDAGLDSLVAVEMRSWWKGAFGLDISVLEMLGMGSVAALGERAVRGLRECAGEAGESQDGGGEKHDTEGYLKLKMP